MAIITSARKRSISMTSRTSVEKALSNKKEEDKIVYIKSGVEVSYGEVVKVINASAKKVFDKIGLVADKRRRRVLRRGPAQPKLERISERPARFWCAPVRNRG